MWAGELIAVALTLVRSGLLSGQNFAPSYSISASHKVITVVTYFTLISSTCLRTLSKCSYIYILCDWLSSLCNLWGTSFCYLYQYIPFYRWILFCWIYHYSQFINVLIISNLGLLQITLLRMLLPKSFWGHVILFWINF